MNEFEQGKKMLLDSLRTLLNLYVNFYLGLSLLGIDFPGMDEKFKIDVEQARNSKLSLDTMISDIERAQSVDEIQSAIEQNMWLNQMLRREDAT